MPRLPYMQFYVSDWIRDTSFLSLPARGAWIAILCALWDSPDRGRLSMPYAAWGRLLGVSGRVAETVIGELIERRVCEANRECNGDVTLVSRRMTRDEKARVYCAKRVSAYRERHKNEGRNGPCNAPVTAQKAEGRRQKAESEGEAAGAASLVPAAADGLANATIGVLADAVANCRPEFRYLREGAARMQVENAIKGEPIEAARKAVADFCGNMTTALELPKSPVALLRGYLRNTTPGGKKHGSDKHRAEKAGREYDENLAAVPDFRG